MRNYYVAKTPNGRFIGAYTIEQIVEQLQAGEIPGDYVATECTGRSYNQLVKIGGAKWVPISQLLSSEPVASPAATPVAASHTDEPVASPAATPVAASHTEYLARRSGWAMTGRAIGALWIGIAIVVVMGLFPPWIESRTMVVTNDKIAYAYTAFFSRGHSFLFAPPTGKDKVFVDLSRLVLQWVMVAAITLGVVATLNRTPIGHGAGGTRPPESQGHQGA
jgi:hypothetical protein